MQFQVPQFIEVEDKIFGPLTIKQFLYLAGSAGLAFVIYTGLKSILPLVIILIPILIVIGIGCALAFYKINNKPFIFVLEAAVKYSLNNKLYIWKKEPRKVEPAKEEAVIENPNLYIPKLSDSKLKDLTWSLDINDSIYSSYTNKKQR